MKHFKDFKDIYGIISIILPPSINNICGLDYPIISIVISIVISTFYYFIIKNNGNDIEFIKIIDSLQLVNNEMDCQFKFNANQEKLSKRIGNNLLLDELIEYHNNISETHGFNFQRYINPSSNKSDIYDLKKDLNEYKNRIIEYKNKIRD